MFDIFSGPLMDEAGDTGGGGGGLGGGTVTLDAGTSTETALATTGETSLAATTDDGGDDGAGGELTVAEQVLENGRPSKTTSAALATIKQTNPQLARAVPRALAFEHRIRSEFPGQNPLDGIRAMRRVIKELGGEDGIAEIRKSLADMEELDLLYAGSDPRMLEKMTETPEAKMAFVKLMPHAFAKYEKLAPKAFTRYMASTILSDIIGQRVDMIVQRVAELTPKELTQADGTKVTNPAVTELAKIQAYFTRLSEFEKLEPEATETRVDPEKEELTRERQKLENERRELAAQGWKSSADATKNRIFQQAWANEIKGKQISAIAQEDLVSAIGRRLPKALGQVAGFQNALKEFYENGDKDGYLQYLQSKHAEHIPRIVRAEVLKRFPAGKTTATATATGTTAVTVKTQVDPGFKRASVMPHMNTVNSRLTTPAMWKEKKAILKDGAKVQWT